MYFMRIMTPYTCMVLIFNQNNTYKDERKIVLFCIRLKCPCHLNAILEDIIFAPFLRKKWGGHFDISHFRLYDLH